MTVLPHVMAHWKDATLTKRIRVRIQLLYMGIRLLFTLFRLNVYSGTWNGKILSHAFGILRV
jgi:hypothetical protein